MANSGSRPSLSKTSFSSLGTPVTSVLSGSLLASAPTPCWQFEARARSAGGRQPPHSGHLPESWEPPSVSFVEAG